MDKILFLDIDGPLIPGRAYSMPNQSKSIVTVFDPCAVGLINKACKKQNRKIVIHSSWILTSLLAKNYLNGKDVHEYCVDQGIDSSLFHDDVYCDRDTPYRYNRIDKWLQEHPGTNDFVVLDDEEPLSSWHYKKNVLLVDFEDGITTKIYRKLADGDWRV